MQETQSPSRIPSPRACKKLCYIPNASISYSKSELLTNRRSLYTFDGPPHAPAPLVYPTCKVPFGPLIPVLESSNVHSSPFRRKPRQSVPLSNFATRPASREQELYVHRAMYMHIPFRHILRTAVARSAHGTGVKYTKSILSPAILLESSEMLASPTKYSNFLIFPGSLLKQSPSFYLGQLPILYFKKRIPLDAEC